ncbi:MAG: alpha/beta hydrolase [Pseudomonadota bacterium]
MRLAAKVLIAVVVVVALATIGVSWRAVQIETAAETAHPPEGQLLDINGQQVHAVVMGAGPDVVLIHGSAGNTRDMTLSLAPALAANYRVIVFDRPGLGYTDVVNPSGASLTQQATLLADAAARLGVYRPIVLGHSYGGAVALAWAVHRPDEIAALVPLAAASNPWESALPTLYRINSNPVGSAVAVPLLTSFVSKDYVAAAIADVFKPQSPPEAYAENVAAALSLRRTSLRANALQRANILHEINDLQPLYSMISVPTEIVHGDADETVGYDIHSVKLARQIPNAVLTRLPGIGHMPHHVATSDVVAAVDRAAARAGLR